jgi:hypothetical protein
MTFSFVLLLVLGAVGGFDNAYYHIWKCHLAREPAAFLETFTHVIHSASAATFFILVNVRACGQWQWLYPAACAVQALNQVADTLIEPSSRAPLGGIPDGEYRLHGIINALWGGCMAALLLESAPLRQQADSISWSPVDMPLHLGLFTYVAIATALTFLLVDVVGLGRQALKSR